MLAGGKHRFFSHSFVVVYFVTSKPLLLLLVVICLLSVDIGLFSISERNFLGDYLGN